MMNYCDDGHRPPKLPALSHGGLTRSLAAERYRQLIEESTHSMVIAEPPHFALLDRPSLLARVWTTIVGRNG